MAQQESFCGGSGAGGYAYDEYEIQEVMEFVKVEHIDEILIEDSPAYEANYDTMPQGYKTCSDEDVMEVDPLAPDPLDISSTSIKQEDYWNSIKKEPVEVIKLEEEEDSEDLRGMTSLDEGGSSAGGSDCEGTSLSNVPIQSTAISPMKQIFEGAEEPRGDNAKPSCSTTSSQSKIYCPICERMFPSQKILDQHLNGHTGERPYECDACGMRFSWESSARRHIQSKHKSRKKIKGIKALATKSSEEAVVLQSEYEKLIESSNTSQVPVEAEDSCDNENSKIQSKSASKCKIFQCHVCDKTFRIQGLLKQHMNTHTGERPYECKYCGMRFAWESNLFRHTSNKHKLYKKTNTQATHEVSALQTQDKAITQIPIKNDCNNLDSKNLSHEDTAKTGPVQCYVCERTFTSQRYLAQHMITHTKEKLFACKFCGKRFSWKRNLETHMLIHKEEITLLLAREGGFENAITQQIEKEDPIKYNSQQALTQQIKEEPPMKFNREANKQTFTQQIKEEEPVKSNLEENLHPLTRQIKEEEPMKSNIGANQQALCKGNNQGAKQLLLSHLRRHTGCHQCKVCGQMFTSRWFLNQHINAQHSKEKPFHCTSCLKRFFWESNLRRHLCTRKIMAGLQAIERKRNNEAVDQQNMTVHSEEISIPLKEAKVREKLRNDGEILTETQVSKEQIHYSPRLNVKGNRCRICHKKFSQLANLNRHMLLHTGEKPFTCKKCEKSFSRKDYLQIHSFKHTKEIGSKTSKQNQRSLENATFGREMQKDPSERLTPSGNSKNVETTYLKSKKKQKQDSLFQEGFSGRETKMVSDERKPLSENSTLAQETCVGNDRHQKDMCQRSSSLEEVTFEENPEKTVTGRENLLGVSSCAQVTHLENKNKAPNSLCEKSISQREMEKISVQREELPENSVSAQEVRLKNKRSDSSSLQEASLEKNMASEHLDMHEMATNEASEPLKKEEYQCIICPKFAKSKAALLVHMQTHMGGNLKNCSICGKHLAGPCQLTRHMLQHTGEKPFQCLTCGKRFSRKDHLHHHSQKHATNTLKNAKGTGVARVCVECGKSFDNENALQEHRLHCLSSNSVVRLKLSVTREKQGTRNPGSNNPLHKSEQNFKSNRLQCYVCKQTFCSKWYLNQHMSIHTGDKPLVCKFCPKAFRFQSLLQKHMKNHSKKTQESLEEKANLHENDESIKKVEEKKDFVLANTPKNENEEENKCPICEQVLNSKKELLRHTHMHAAEELKCKICHKIMSSTSYFLRHMVTHTREKLHQCKVCGQKYAWKESLDRHNKKHACENHIPIHDRNGAEPKRDVTISKEEKTPGNSEEINTTFNDKSQQESIKGGNQKTEKVMKGHSPTNSKKFKNSLSGRVDASHKSLTHHKHSHERYEEQSKKHSKKLLKRVTPSSTVMPELQAKKKVPKRSSMEKLENAQKTKQFASEPGGNALRGKVSVSGMTEESRCSNDSSVNNLLEEHQNIEACNISEQRNATCKSVIPDTMKQRESLNGVIKVDHYDSCAAMQSQSNGTVQDHCLLEKKECESKKVSELSIISIEHSDIHNEMESQDIAKGKRIKDSCIKNPFKTCNLCGKVFSKRQKLLMHLKNKSCVGHTCNICQKKYRYKGYLEKHMLTHDEKLTQQEAADVEAVPLLEEPEVIIIDSRSPSPKRKKLLEPETIEIEDVSSDSGAELKFEPELADVPSTGVCVEDNRKAWDSESTTINAVLPEKEQEAKKENTGLSGSSSYSSSSSRVQMPANGPKSIPREHSQGFMDGRTDTSPLSSVELPKTEPLGCCTSPQPQMSVNVRSQMAASWKDPGAVGQSNNGGGFRNADPYVDPPPYPGSPGPWHGAPSPGFVPSSTGYLGWIPQTHHFHGGSPSVPGFMTDMPLAYPGNIYNYYPPPPYSNTYLNQFPPSSSEVLRIPESCQNACNGFNQPQNVCVQSSLSISHHQLPNLQCGRRKKNRSSHPD